MKSDDLIASARILTSASAGVPGPSKQADIHRAISTAYYAAFHELCRTCADMLVGGAGSNRSDGAWRQVYRSVQHGDARRRCRSLSGGSVNFPTGILVFARNFDTLQQERHEADYDPAYRVTPTDAEALISHAETAIAQLRTSDTRDRRAFCVWVLFGQR